MSPVKHAPQLLINIFIDTAEYLRGYHMTVVIGPATIAIGSASELEYLLLLSRDIELINEADFTLLIGEAIEVKKMLISFFQKLKANC